MAYRVWKPRLCGHATLKSTWANKKKKSNPKMSAASRKRAEDILKLIRSRQQVNIWHGFPEREPVSNRPMDNDNWQRFKKNFVDLYGGEKVKETGMTDSEFWDWFKTGKRELDKVEGAKLRQLLEELHSKEDD